MYEYEAALIRVVDGDTLDLMVDQGLEVLRPMRVRLASINTPELNSTDEVERARAKKAKEFAQTWLLQATAPLIIKTFKDKREKYGRYLVTVQAFPNGMTLNQVLIDAGLAVPYMELKTSPAMPPVRARGE